MKSKNVCLQLVDAHQTLMSGGVVQLFSVPHPHKFVPSPYLGRSPPKPMPFATSNDLSEFLSKLFKIVFS